MFQAPRILSIVGLGIRMAVGLTALTLMAIWLRNDGPIVIRLLPTVLALVTLRWPVAGVAGAAFLMPISSILTSALAADVPPSRLAEQEALAVILAAPWLRTGERLRIGPWAGWLAALAVASLLSLASAQRLVHLPTVSWSTLAGDLASGGVFTRSAPFEPLFFCMLLLEGLALAAATESVVRRAPAAFSRVAWSLVIGLGVSVIGTITRVARAVAGRDQGLGDFLGVIGEIRLAPMTDLNAAGSLYLLGLILVAGLTRGAWRIIAAGGVATTLLAGIWLSGSRSVMASLAVVALGWAAWAAIRRSGHARWMALALAVVTVVGGLAIKSNYSNTRNVQLNKAIGSRAIMWAVAGRMVADAPVFGVGIGRFYELSPEYGAVPFRPDPAYPTIHENAHNNFLHVIAELGLVGGAAFILVLLRVMTSTPRTSAQLALGAFMLTWLVSHPLLVVESALVFWLVAGLVCARGDLPVRRSHPWLVMAGATALLILIPVRSEGHRNAANLEHRGLDVAPLWETAADGVRFRRAHGPWTLFVATGTHSSVLIRLEDAAAAPVLVNILIEGKVVNRVTMASDGWTEVALALPPATRQYMAVAFTPAAPVSGSIMVGRVTRSTDVR